MPELLKRFRGCESGAAAVEYSVIAVAMFLALVPAFIYVASAMEVKFTRVTSYFGAP